MSVLTKLRRYVTNEDYRFIIHDGLGFYRYLPDEDYLKRKFRVKLGYPLDLAAPKTFNEKLQWLKLYDRKPEYTMMVDKYAVKNYVAEKIGEEYIIPTLGVWDHFDDIDFAMLPNQFVLKCTHDSGGLVICRDKNKLNLTEAKTRIEKSLKRDYYLVNREWPYKDVKPHIIAETFMQDETQISGLRDYKFYCFHGEPKFLYISEGLENHSTASISFLNMDWTFAPFQRVDYKTLDQLPEKPKNYEKMVEIARMLSDGIPFLRVDLYEIAGKVYFSELTFTPCAGMTPFTPPQWDEELGKLLRLS